MYGTAPRSLTASLLVHNYYIAAQAVLLRCPLPYNPGRKNCRRIMSKTMQEQSLPWEMPIWKPVRGKEGVLVHLVAIHVIAVIGFILYPIPSIPVFVTAFVFNLLGGLGTTVCNHRYLAHRTLKLN